MANKNFPLQEKSINDIYCGTDNVTYEIPIYQRNYAWGKDEIETMINDVCNAREAGSPVYHIGTLVTFDKEDKVYEVIDGQQRLTTIYLILRALGGIEMNNKLTYKARKKSDYSLKHLSDNSDRGDGEESDVAINKGYEFALAALNEMDDEQRDAFEDYFISNVHLIWYHVPQDIDLNHYFEVMNSRGEQLEMHEIVKAEMMEKLRDDEQEMETFATIWESCSEMNVYIQQKWGEKKLFGNDLSKFKCKSFDDIKKCVETKERKQLSIEELTKSDTSAYNEDNDKKLEGIFQPIIDFPNFLLIVLKLMRLEEEDFEPAEFNLDDKFLIKEFNAAFNKADVEKVKKFGFMLLKAKYFLDNYIVHHLLEEDQADRKPWRLQYWQNKEDVYPKNLEDNDALQDHLVHILSMFEVTFTPRQRKNYLLYCLWYLFDEDTDIDDHLAYLKFLEGLAEKYLRDVYMQPDSLNERNLPKPKAFDEAVLEDGEVNLDIDNDSPDFYGVFGDGTVKSKGIPLFVFNYLDYRIWAKYAKELRGKEAKKGSTAKTAFFNDLGCPEFNQKTFVQFYFSRTRRSLEHFFPQANIDKQEDMDEKIINCFGNFAMIGSAANSSGSNWMPKSKVDYYLDKSDKIDKVSVMSLKFYAMMYRCKANKNDEDREGFEWNSEDIKEHQEKMIKILGLL